MIAAAVLVAGTGGAALYRSRITNGRVVVSGIADVRARLESIRYRIDGVPENPRIAEVARLADAAEASLASARQYRSARACAEADAMLDRAETELARGTGE